MLFKVSFRHSSVRTQARVAALLVLAVGVAVVGASVSPEVAVAAGTASISGTVTGAGSPAVPAASNPVDAYLSDGTLAGSDLTDSSGHYQISGLEPGSYTLFFGGASVGVVGGGSGDPNAVWLDQWWSGQPHQWSAQFFTVAAGAAVIGKDAVLPKGGTISGTVRDSTHTGVSGVAVEVSMKGDQRGVIAVTAADGSYTVGGLASGYYWVTASALGSFPGAVYDGHTSPLDPSKDYVALNAPSTVSGIDLTGAAPATVAGNVSVGGVPVSGGTVAASPTDAEGTDLNVTPYRVFAEIDGAGNYSLQLAPGDYNLFFLSGWYSTLSYSHISVSAGQSLSKNYAAPQFGTISGTISPALEGQITATDGNGNFYQTTSSAGSYSLNVPAGTYTEEFQPSGTTYATQWWGGTSSAASAQSFTVTSGTNITKSFSVLAAGTISGTVRSAGNPVSDGYVQALDSAGNYLTSATVAPDGTFTLLGLGTDTYYIEYQSNAGIFVQYYGGGSSLASATGVSVAAGGAVTGKDFDIPIYGAISGKVTDIAGVPLYGGAAVVYSPGGGSDFDSNLLVSSPIHADGTYAVTGLPPGNYKVAFTTFWGGWYDYEHNVPSGGLGWSPAMGPSDPFVTQWSAGKYSYGSADVVSVSTGVTTSGIDAQLENPTFVDASDPTSVFYTYIQWMASSGVSTGTVSLPGKPLYKPSVSVSRQAMAAFMLRLSGDSFTAPVTPTFADVDSGSPFYAAVEWMAAQGISTGTAQPSGKPLYKPADPVSRQAMALFLARYAHASLTTPTEQSFADVPINAGPAAAISWMASTGISTGTAQPTGLPLYKPADPVSRQAMAAFLYRLAHLTH